MRTARAAVRCTTSFHGNGAQGHPGTMTLPHRANVSSYTMAFPKNGYTIKFYPQMKTLEPNTAAPIEKLVVKGLTFYTPIVISVIFNALSVKEVMRIKDMITQQEFRWYIKKFSPSLL